MGDDPKLLHHFRGHKDGLTGVDFNPSQKQVASCSLDHSVMLWSFTKDSSKAYRQGAFF